MCSNITPLVYMHIGKTAGTSLRDTLVKAFGSNSCCPPFRQTVMSAEEAASYGEFPIICGHISRADQKRWFASRPVLSILRRPVERGLSFLRYVRSLPPESCSIAADARRLSMLDLIATDEGQINLDNTMVRQLGGHMLDRSADLGMLLAQAKETLKEALWIGMHDTLLQDLARLSAILKVELEPMYSNVTPGCRSLSDVDPAITKRLSELSTYDLELWNWMKASIS